MKLRYREQQFMILAEHSPDIIIRIDRQLCHVYVNSAIEKTTGLIPEKFIGKTIKELGLHDPETCCLLENSIREVLETGKEREIEFIFHSKIGSLFCNASLIPELSQDGSVEFVLGVVRDITEKKEGEELLRAYSNFITTFKEMEYQRISRELHDSVIQLLGSAQFRFQDLSEKILKEDRKSQCQAERVKNLLDEAIRETRRIARNMRPPTLDDLGIMPALRSFIEEFSDRTGIVVTLNLLNAERRYPEEIELASYRLVQEAFSNIEKHSQASCVNFSISCTETLLTMTIQDNGKGFDPARKTTSRGFGLIGMKERVEILSGSISFASTPGHGVTIHVCFPCPPSYPPPEGRKIKDSHGRA